MTARHRAEDGLVRSPHLEEGVMDAGDVVAFALVLGIIAVSLLSNATVLVCFLYSPEIRKQVAGLFVLNLTLGNLLLSAANMPLTLAALVAPGNPGLGGFCQVGGFLDTFLTTNAMLSVAALGVDRWAAVVFPLSYRTALRRRDAVAALGYAWTHSLCFSAVAACRSWVGYHRLYASCTLCEVRATGAGTQFAVFTLALHCLTFLLTLVVLCVTYLKVLRVARFHCRRIDVITMQTLVLLVDIHPSVRQKCLDEQKRRRLRATKKISTFIGTFVVCFTPYVITRVVEVLCLGPISPKWGVLSKCLAYSKAASDPFVYSLLCHQYKKTCSLLVNRVLKRSPHNPYSARMENTSGRENRNSDSTDNIPPSNNKPFGQ